jgi:hypothetical protein
MPQQSVFALLNIDGSRNQVFVFGNFTVAYDSNINASAIPESDTIFTASVGAELKRRAGIIAVNARAVFAYQKFSNLDDQTSWNPTFFLELNKTTGRTTGALTINAFRSSRADSAVNLRTQTWNFPIGLNLKYPVNDKYYLTSATGYMRRSYADTTQLLNYTDYTQALNLFYVYTSKLDLFASYRVRIGQTNLGTTTDHYLGFGAEGGLLAKLRGSLRIGYQTREVGASGERFGQFSIGTGLFWNATRKLTFNTTINQDFSTTATGGTVDTFSSLFRTAFVFTRRVSVDASVGYGRNKFLSGNQSGRRDDFYTADLNAIFALNEHFRFSVGYNYLKNLSNVAQSDFERSGYSLDVSTRF